MRFSTQYTLYLGRDIGPSPFVGCLRDIVERPAFNTFLADHVTERFPGFTLSNVEGYWQGTPEQSFLLTIVGDSADGSAISEIAAAYKAAFKQESVLVVQSAIVGVLV